MEDKKIEVVKNWSKSKSMRNIQVFFGFANFYWHFIQGFNKIAGPLTLMLRTTQSAQNLASLMTKDTEVGSISTGNCRDKTVKKSPLTSKNSNRAISYLTPKARLAFTQLRKAFTKTSILWHFAQECYIRIETDTSSYAIAGVLTQLILNNLSQ